MDGARLEGDVHTTRADSYRMSALIGENWLAVGDAAMAFDPLSSHGLYNAMKSAIEAARALQRHFAGDGAGLSDYAGWAQRRFTRFVDMRAAYYGRETRWPGFSVLAAARGRRRKDGSKENLKRSGATHGRQDRSSGGAFLSAGTDSRSKPTAPSCATVSRSRWRAHQLAVDYGFQRYGEMSEWLSNS